MIIGMGTPSSQSRIPRPIVPSRISYGIGKREAPSITRACDIAPLGSIARGERNNSCHNTVIDSSGKDLMAMLSARNTPAQG